MVLPLIALLGTAVTPAVGVPPIPANWTVDNFTSVVTERTLAAFGRTALLAVTAAVLLTVLGAAVAGLERGHGGRLIATLVTATLVLPGSTLAVALLISYGRWLADTLILICSPTWPSSGLSVTGRCPALLIDFRPRSCRPRAPAGRQRSPRSEPWRCGRWPQPC